MADLNFYQIALCGLENIIRKRGTGGHWRDSLKINTEFASYNLREGVCGQASVWSKSFLAGLYIYISDGVQVDMSKREE